MKQGAIILPVTFLLSVFLLGCGRESPPKDNVVAYVNKEPVTASELKREIALRAKQDPSFKVTPETEQEQLDVIINRKIIIQAAMQKGLAREERFVNTIKTFWEQTLIRDFIDYKKKAFKDYLFVTDDDVKKYYDNLSKRVTFRILRSKDKAPLDKIYEEFKKNNAVDTSAWEQVGPVAYEDIASGALLSAFRMNEGQMSIFEDLSHTYYLIMVASIEKIEIGPLEELRSGIEKRILAMKERQLFEQWLGEKRKKAKIEMIGG